MAQSIRCPHCGKSYVLKPELAGKQVRCRQCQKAFTVPAAAPGDGLEEPIVLSLAVPDPPFSTLTFPDFKQDLASGPTVGRPGAEETLTVGTVLPLRGQTILSPVAVRRRSQAGSIVWQRLQERALTATVACVSLGLLVLFILLFFVAGVPGFFLVPPVLGVGLAALGLSLPVPKRRGRRGPTFSPPVRRIAVSCGAFGLVFGILFGILLLAGLSGHPIPPAIGLSPENAIAVVLGLLWATGICFGACLLTLVLSALWSLACEHGFVRVFNFLYLGASPLVFLALCACAMGNRWTRPGPPVAHQPPVAYRPSTPPMNHNTGMPSGWPPNQTWPTPTPMPMPRAEMGPMAPRSLPPGAINSNDPEFYRRMLAELRSPDASHRRVAVAVLAHAEPKELREEIAKALESLMGDSDDMLRSESLRALDVWSTDVVPIAIRALQDSSVFVRNPALDILERRKDPRAIEPMVALLSDPMSMRVARCLEQMGSQVEDAVLAHYDGGNSHARRFIIQILGAVATEKGIAKLRQIAADKSDRSSAVYARFMLHRRGVSVAD